MVEVKKSVPKKEVIYVRGGGQYEVVCSWRVDFLKRMLSDLGVDCVGAVGGIVDSAGIIRLALPLLSRRGLWLITESR